jgi:hypothetical protein
MRIRAYAPAAVVGMTFALTALRAGATPTVIAVGQPSRSAAGSYADLSGLVGTLKDGSAMNLLGGIGSGLAWAGGNTFIAMPDRGANASTYNPLVDNTTSYIDRFRTVQMALTPVPSKIEGVTFGQDVTLDGANFHTLWRTTTTSRSRPREQTGSSCSQ